jgi:hypothetical protein
MTLSPAASGGWPTSGEAGTPRPCTTVRMIRANQDAAHGHAGHAGQARHDKCHGRSGPLGGLRTTRPDHPHKGESANHASACHGTDPELTGECEDIRATTPKASADCSPANPELRMNGPGWVRAAVTVAIGVVTLPSLSDLRRHLRRIRTRDPRIRGQRRCLPWNGEPGRH